jgi:hypothetical protein
MLLGNRNPKGIRHTLKFGALKNIIFIGISKNIEIDRNIYLFCSLATFNALA